VPSRIVAAVVFAVAALLCGAAPAPANDPPLAIIGVTVIPMTGTGVVLKDQTVIVRDGRIAAIGPRARTKAPAGTRRIDGIGKFLIPGLTDVHVHLPVADVVRPGATPEALRIDDALFLFLANGVTRVQVMAGTADALKLRDEIRSGARLGPRMGVNTPMLDGPTPIWPAPMGTSVTAANAGERVRGLKAQGYDRIKVYSLLQSDAFDAVTAAARANGMPVDGHIPRAVGAERFLASGASNVAHAEEFIPDLNRSGKPAAYFAELTKNSGVWVTPTLTTYHQILLQAQDLPAVLARDVNAYAHPGVLANWSPQANRYRTFSQPAQLKRITEGWDSVQQMTRALHVAGVPLLTGTDVLNPPILPGFYLHDELRELVEVGLTPYEALEASTRNSARFFGEEQAAGTVEIGKRADLLLLTADPLRNIGASRSIDGVIIGGHWIGRQEIAARLAAIREFYARNRTNLETYSLAPARP
jgi:imidazolonepropionase-like amidohydrolase